MTISFSCSHKFIGEVDDFNKKLVFLGKIVSIAAMCCRSCTCVRRVNEGGAVGDFNIKLVFLGKIVHSAA